MAEKDAKLEITVEAESREYEFTAPIALKVNYKNISSASIKLKDPDNVWEVKFVREYRLSSENDAFGKITVSRPNDDTELYEIPQAEVLSLMPGEKYSFESDAAIRFYSLFHPGQLVLKVIDVSDDDLTLESNSVSVTVRFKNESVARLMAIVGDEAQPLEYRIWSADWLKKVKDDFSPSFAIDEAPAEIKESSRASIEEALNKFRSWWVTFENSDAANILMTEINDRYFKMPEEIPEEEESEEDEL